MSPGLGWIGLDWTGLLGSRANLGLNDECTEMVKINTLKNGDGATEERLARPKDTREAVWRLEKPQVTSSTWS